MCGICGEIRFDGSVPDVSTVDAMTCEMARRGPDGSGVFAKGAVALGHRRLKIIDLSEKGSQPMIDRRWGLALVFNGCIYNHHELRAELEGKGVLLLLPRRQRGDPEGLPRLGALTAWTISSACSRLRS